MLKSRFENPWPHDSHGVGDILKWKLRLIPSERPLIPEASNRPAGWKRLFAEEIATPPTVGWRIAWLGHASFLVQGMGISILIDPVFSEFCSPVPFPSLRRKVPPPCEIGDLPGIHTVLLTHSHYDHLDLETLELLGEHSRLIVPKGHEAWLTQKRRFRHVHEIGWYEKQYVVAGMTVTATPAQHFTARTPFDRNEGHWCGWLLEGNGCKIWHAGDSAYCPAFEEIGRQHGPIDFGMIPIGAYQPRRIMKAMHMNPEEAVQVFEETRCSKAVGMHWGTFSLTDEPMQEPPLRLKKELERKGLGLDGFTTGRVGDIWEIMPVS